LKTGCIARSVRHFSNAGRFMLESWNCADHVVK